MGTDLRVISAQLRNCEMFYIVRGTVVAIYKDMDIYILK